MSSSCVAKHRFASVFKIDSGIFDVFIKIKAFFVDADRPFRYFSTLKLIKFSKRNPEHFNLTLSFLIFKKVADFRRSRLVGLSCNAFFLFWDLRKLISFICRLHRFHGRFGSEIDETSFARIPVYQNFAEEFWNPL